jgi:hypothetical protein
MPRTPETRKLDIRVVEALDRLNDRIRTAWCPSNRDIREAAQLAVEFIRAARAYLAEADADHRPNGAPIARREVMGGGTIDRPEDP